MSKKVFTCNNCGFVFPEELIHLIKTRVQVYCEKCGTPFTLGKPEIKNDYFISRPKKSSSSLTNSIQILNKFSYIPILVVSIIFCILIGISPRLFFLGIVGIAIALYDIAFVSPKIKSNRYDLIVLDSFCMGILGCIIYGTGVLILIKGLLILIYSLSNPENKDRKMYDFGLELKNSLNNFSALAGFLIILLAFSSIIELLNIIPPGIFILFLLMAVITLFIDLGLRRKIKMARKFKIFEALGIFILGVIGCVFAASGIFVLLKGIICLFLMVGEPSEVSRKEITTVEEKPTYPPPKYIEPKEPIQEEKPEEFYPKEKEIEIKEIKEPSDYEIPPTKQTIEKPVEKIEEKEPTKDEDKKPEMKEEEDFELKLHESLLPVKDEKDKELVMEYLSKIFTVLSKDLRKQIIDLKIPKKEKKELLKELAFLAKEEQIRYIEAIINLYREIPVKLIERIKKLPNVRPEHYAKIAEQLKFMNYDEQEMFIQYLEKHA